jgi:hypothetical protein
LGAFDAVGGRARGDGGGGREREGRHGLAVLPEEDPGRHRRQRSHIFPVDYGATESFDTGNGTSLRVSYRAR